VPRLRAILLLVVALGSSACSGLRYEARGAPSYAASSASADSWKPPHNGKGHSQPWFTGASSELAALVLIVVGILSLGALIAHEVETSQ
jgi:hypothetical protein